MTEPTLAALGDDSGGPLHLSRTGSAASDQAGASLDVLRQLHADWVRQLRNQVIGGSVVLAAFILVSRLIDGASGSMLLFLGLWTAQWARTAIEWQRARRSDPSAVVSDEIVGETARERGRSETLRRLMSERGAAATWTIAGVVIAVGIIEWLTAGTELKTVARAGLVKPLVSEGEWWRLVTSAFVHANLWHLAGNVTVLVAVGRIVEAYAPRPWLLLTYASAAVAGNVVSWWLAPGADSLGASGAIMGVVGFLLVLGWRRPDDVPKTVRERVWMTVIAAGFIGALSIGLIDNAAHAGGAVAGAVLGLIAVPRRRSEIAGASRTWLSVIGLVSAIVIGAGAIQATLALAGGSTAVMARRPLGPATIVPITSVSAAVRRDDAGWFLAITNRSRHVLEAYEITFGGPQGGHMRRDDCCFARSEPGPVPAGDAIRIRLDTIRAPAPLSTRAAFSFAMFSDGSFEGSSRARDVLIRRRTQTEREAAYWISTIDKVAAGSPADAARRLSLYMEARSKYDDVSFAALAAFGIPELVKATEQDPARFNDAAAATRAGLVASRDALALRLAQPRTPR
ncbi:MAG TPA: rhomboid family intramembrane serine protease [Vicinamibacterales bacterium]|nr:rhomboid family intramembrane serine protease [Vicinamibacterales bacterium]